MIANRLKPALLCAALVAGFGTLAHAEGRWQHNHGSQIEDRIARPDLGNTIDYRAGERGRERHRERFVENARRDRQGDGRRNRPAEIDRQGIYSSSSISRVRPSGNFYGGGLSAYAERGNGIYFLRDDNYWPAREEAGALPAPRAKIIDVEDSMRKNTLAARNGCSFEHGVCVIRGDR